MINKDFYPTPKRLINKMLAKIQGHPHKILEPSAGKGDIIEAMTEPYNHFGNTRFNIHDIYAIENDPELQATLRGKKINLLDSDFLTYAGPDKFSLVIGNPPFAEGDKHLLKAIDILYRGEIVFLLSAETIKNPYTPTRQLLVKKLDQLNADIGYLKGEFSTAERPTNVEVALVYIKVERQVEDDLFQDCTDRVHPEQYGLDTVYEVSTKKTLEELVAEYNEVIRIGTETIVGYYRNYKKVGQYISINCTDGDRNSGQGEDLTGQMQNALNDLLANVRKSFWRRTLDLAEVRRRLTKKKQAEFETQLESNCCMDFTENNIRQFVLNFIGGYEQTLTDAVLEIFNMFTREYCYSDGLYDDNIHYFNGWKTNKAFKVNRKVIIPVYGGYGRSSFVDDYSGKWKLNWGVEEKLRDIDVVMNSLDGKQDYLTIAKALEQAFAVGQSSKIQSTYFTVTAYKKGTLHLIFNDENILRRFNVAACMGKEFLPHDYGHKPYGECATEEKAVIDAFEGVDSYMGNLGQPLFAYQDNLLLITAAA